MRLSQSVWSLHLLASIHARQTPSRILGQGIEAWNRWRAEAPEVRPCLNGADLRGIDFGIPICISRPSSTGKFLRNMYRRRNYTPANCAAVDVATTAAEQ